MRTLVAIIAVASSLALAQQSEEPSFEQFKVKTIFHGAPAAAMPKTIKALQFRTVIRNGAKKGPNFAGHYTVVVWGCGTSCASLAIVDAMSGRVFDAPFSGITWSDGRGPVTEEGLEFKVDSALLVAKGCPEETDCAARYYRWNGQHMTLLLKRPLKRLYQYWP